MRAAIVATLILASVGCGDDAASPVDSGTARDAPGPRVDSGAGPEDDAAAPRPDGGPTDCVAARRLWFDDFETGDYARWTSMTYGGDWGDDCQSNGLSTDHAVSGTTAQRSEIVCAGMESHRGYGGVQFDGGLPPCGV